MAFEVDRDDLHHTRTVDDATSVPPPNGSLLRIEAFALTANNISYAAFGDMLRYWEFFPASSRDGDSGHWGRVPVWGFAEILDGGSPGLGAGRRVYGYLPMATTLAVEPGRVDDRGFTDLAPHRRPMAGAYNRYLFTDRDPIHDPEREPHQMVLWPLFVTSFLIDDFLADNDRFGASTVVVSSASSKTAIGAASLLATRPGVDVIGLTSPAHRSFVEALGCYAEVITYDDLDRLPATDAVYVDIAGNRDVQVAVHDRYGDRLHHSMVVGGTHWDHRTESPPARTGPTPAFFFAPAQIAKRVEDWGQAALDERVGEAWRRFATWADGWIRFEHRRGPAAVEAAYRTLLEGRADPRVGYVCSMDPEGEPA